MSHKIVRNPYAALAPLGLFLLASCQAEQPASGPARFDGVVAATVSAFTSTSDRCTFSFLFDNFRVEWRPSTQLKPGQAGAETERSFTLAAAPGARGNIARFDIKGSYMRSGPAATATANVSIGGKDHAIVLPDGEGTNAFDQRIEAVVPADADLIPVIIRTAIAKPQSSETEALLDIDSVDLVLVAPGCGTDAAPTAAPAAPANSS
jgi:hypothetical protein